MLNLNTSIGLGQWAPDDWESSGAIELFDANVKVLDGDRALNKILYSDKLPRTNPGRLAGGILTQYSHVSQGGWWMPVLNPSANFSEGPWGCFKPIQPRTKQDGVNLKLIKYEHPPKEPIQPYFLKVTHRVWERIAKRHNTEMPTVLPQTSYGQEFWEWAIAHNLPIVITEGAKKAASLLCAGYVAIGVPGVWNFSKKVDEMEAWETPLNEQLQRFFEQFERPQITIAYDADTRPQTVKNVTNASIRLAKKLQWNVNANIRIAKWHPELGKGADDVLVTGGLSTLEKILDDAVPYQNFCFLEHCRLTYPLNHQIDQRYLGQLPEFNQKIVGIKSPKNTGKTYALSSLCDGYREVGQRIIVITHRVQLGSELANRLGIEFINEIETKDQWQMAALQGFVLCIDSLHPHSKARIDLADNFNFDGAVVIIDESEQVLNHLVNSSTLKSNRAEIVTQLEMLCQRAEKIYLSDADLSNYSIDFFRNLAELGKSDVAIIQNEYRFTDSAWSVSLYSERTPDRLLLELEKQLQQGSRVLLHVSGQKAKSLFSAQNILKRLTPYCTTDDPEIQAGKCFNRLKPYSVGKTLLIDSHTVADPDDEAFGIVSHLNNLMGYQLVVASPVIETGVSIETDLFDAVFCISYGVQSVCSVAQALARYRRPVPRHIWMQKRPANMMKFGGKVLSSKQCHHYLTSNKKRLQKVLSDFPLGSNGIYNAYVESVVRFNLGHQAYRENLKYLLAKDGHQCTEIEALEMTDQQIREIRDKAYQEEIEAIASSEAPGDIELEVLNNAVAKTKAERYKERKGNLIRTYGQCSEEIVKADDDGCFKPLQLLYYMTVGRMFLETHDSKQCEKFTSKTQTLDHEIGKSVLGVQVAVLAQLNRFGFLNLIDLDPDSINARWFAGDVFNWFAGEVFNNSHPMAKAIANVNPDDFLATFGRSLPGRLGDRINVFLDLIGFKKIYVCRVGTGADAVRHYQAIPKFEGIDYQQIFEHWLERDRAANDFVQNQSPVSPVEEGDRSMEQMGESNSP